MIVRSCLYTFERTKKERFPKINERTWTLFCTSFFSIHWNVARETRWWHTSFTSTVHIFQRIHRKQSMTHTWGLAQNFILCRVCNFVDDFNLPLVKWSVDSDDDNILNSQINMDLFIKNLEKLFHSKYSIYYLLKFDKWDIIYHEPTIKTSQNMFCVVIFFILKINWGPSTIRQKL